MSVSARILFVTVKVKTEVKFAVDTWIFYQNLILPQLRSDSHSPPPPPPPPPPPKKKLFASMIAIQK